MKPTVAVRVQHHPSRADMLGRLSGVLPGLEAVPDPRPNDPPEAWRTYAQCLRMIGAATHVLVLQDDVTLHPDLPHVLPSVVAARPDNLLSLYHGWLPSLGARAVRQAGARGDNWAELPVGSWCPAQALVWPRALAAQMLAWSVGQRGGADDGLIGQWLRQAKQRAYCTVPNLVEHPDEPSLISRAQRGGNPQRMSCCQPPIECDVASIDWT